MVSVRRRLVAAVFGGSLVFALAAQAGINDDWPGYLSGSGHGSSSPNVSITVADVPGLTHAWTFMPAGATVTGQPGGSINASPTVSGGRVYLGANTGVFSAIDLDTGAKVWERSLGFVPALTCSARGITATASVAADPVSGAATVYAAGGDGYLYALNAADGAVRWRSVVGTAPSATANDYYTWSSPTVVGDRVYIGVSSQCDKPLVRGGLLAFDRATGNLAGSYWVVPAGTIGGGIWSSAVAAGGKLYVTTGNAPQNAGDSNSLVRLDAATMTREESWQVPPADQTTDSDFGASPTVFQATLNGQLTTMLGACNKNGVFYALRAANMAAGPVWTLRVGESTSSGGSACLPAAIWDGSRLFIGGNATTIGGGAFEGSLRRVDPATGAVIWERGLGGNVLGSPSLNGANVIAAATYDTTVGVNNGTYMLDARDGTVLRFITVNGEKEFAQPVFAGSYLLLGTLWGGLNAYIGAGQPQDTTPPSQPTNLRTTSVTSQAVDLAWNGSTDTVGVTGYDVLRGGVKIGQATTTTFHDGTVAASTSYRYSVLARDAAGNLSQESSAITVTTPATPSGALFSDDFETGTMSRWTSIKGLVAKTSPVHAGVWAAVVAKTTSGYTKFATKTLASPAGEVSYRVAFRVASRSTPLTLLALRSPTNGGIYRLYLTATGRLAYQNLGSGVSRASTTAVSSSVWHTLKVHITTGAGGRSDVTYDGAVIASLTRLESLPATTVGRIQLGDTVATHVFNAAFDDLTVYAGTGP